MSDKEIPSEVYFLKYAFPCSQILKLRGQITDEDIAKLKDAVINEKVLDRDYLERIYWKAFERMEPIVEELGRDKWDKKVFEVYFRERHTAMVNGTGNPERFKDLCRIHIASVEETKNGEMIVSYEGGKKRKVKGDFVKDVKVGDKVTIHYDYAVEKV